MTSDPQNPQPQTPSSGSENAGPRKPLKIGSQREPIRPLKTPPPGFTPSKPTEAPKPAEAPKPVAAAPVAEAAKPDVSTSEVSKAIDTAIKDAVSAGHAGAVEAASPVPAASDPLVSEAAAKVGAEQPQPLPPAAENIPVNFPPPRLSRISPELEDEIEAALGGMSLEAMLAKEAGGATPGELALESSVSATVVKIHRDDVFVRLPNRSEGVTSLRQFATEPTIGQKLDVVINKFNAEEGLYEVGVPGAAVHVGDWSDINVGSVIEVRITGHNKGGLECEVNNIRGFIPASQVAMYRIEDFAQFVDQRLLCVVTEADRENRNLVLSHRAILERQKEEGKKNLLASLAVGQIHEGIVRSLRDFGAFVDIGGIDGLLHISQLAWDRVRHPKDVLEEGQKIRVKIEKIDPVTGKLSFAYRDMLESPWQKVEEKYPVNSIVKGTVTRIADFGAFVRLEAGIEGLVHVSEIAHHRVVRVGVHLKEGQEVEAKILSVDEESQRISLSIKGMTAAPANAKKEKDEAAAAEAEEARPAYVPKRTNLKGGLKKSSGGDQFGLKW